MVDITQIPNAPNFVEGIISLRGVVTRSRHKDVIERFTRAREPVIFPNGIFSLCILN